MMEGQLEPLRQALDSENPLQALWQFQTTWSQASLGVEFMALANHRKAIRDEISRRAEEARQAQSEMLAERLAGSAGLDEVCSPMCLTTLLWGAARLLANEEAAGITSGHSEVRNFVEWAIARLEDDRRRVAGKGEALQH